MRGAGRQCIARRTVRGIARRGIAGCAAVALLLCAVPTTAYADVKDTEKKLNEAKEEKKKTENALNSTREELGDLQETTEGLKGELNSLNNSLTQVSNNLADLEEQIRIKLGEIDKTQAALEEAERIEREQYEAMKKRIQFMYEKRDYILLEMLFGSASFSELLNRNEYIEQLSAYDRQQLASYQEGGGGAEPFCGPGQPDFRQDFQLPAQDFGGGAGNARL